MKKLFLVIVTVLMTVSVSAQKGEKAIGLSLGYGTEVKNLAIGAKFNYNITDPIQLSPSFNYFLKKDGVSAWEINADVHYLFSIAENLNLYPLAGLSFIGSKFSYGDVSGLEEYLGVEVEDSGTSTNIGLNLGGGVSYGITDNISIGAELKYSISDFDQLVLSANIMYKF